MKKKSFSVIAATCALALGMCGLAACSGGTSSGSDASSGAAAEYSDDSLIAMHEGFGTDISDLTDVSVESCTSSCHDGSFDSVVEATDALWEGIGQITDANPHASHASNAYACSDCHSLTGTSVNVCNACHDFDTPEGWVDKDSTTTTYGLTLDESLY